jgi:hypothetical protein
LIAYTTPPSTSGVVTVFAIPLITLSVDVASASKLPVELYVAIVYTSEPATAGAITVYVHGAAVHALTSVVTEAGVPEYAAPFTLTRVIATDDVAGETYAARRARDDAVLGAGMVIVNRALVIAALPSPGRVLPPPEHPHSPSEVARTSSGTVASAFMFVTARAR